MSEPHWRAQGTAGTAAGPQECVLLVFETVLVQAYTQHEQSTVSDLDCVEICLPAAKTKLSQRQTQDCVYLSLKQDMCGISKCMNNV